MEKKIKLQLKILMLLDIIKDLIRLINKNNNKFQLVIPSNNHFKHAFINTIQKFELPEKFIINHNDLSEFSRYFFAYVILVIEPRKKFQKIFLKLIKKINMMHI